MNIGSWTREHCRQFFEVLVLAFNNVPSPLYAVLTTRMLDKVVLTRNQIYQLSKYIYQLKSQCMMKFEIE